MSDFPSQPKNAWCPGCSREVAEPCHHFNCAVGPNSMASIASLKDRNRELEGALQDALCELTACAVQMNIRTGGSVFRAQERARAALQPKNTK